MAGTKSIEVVATEVQNLTKEVGELKAQFVMFQTSFVRQDLYTIKHTELEREVATTKAEIRALKNFRWFLLLVASIIGAIFSYLIQYVLSHPGKGGGL